jgi:hypothetical protein
LAVTVQEPKRFHALVCHLLIADPAVYAPFEPCERGGSGGLIDIPTIADMPIAEDLEDLPHPLKVGCRTSLSTCARRLIIGSSGGRR